MSASPFHHASSAADDDDHDDGNNNGGVNDPDLSEICHYVATAHPAGSVFSSVRCSFLLLDLIDVVVVKSNRLEVCRFWNTTALAEVDPDGGGGGASGDAADRRQWRRGCLKFNESYSRSRR